MESIPREHLVQVQVADNQFDFVRVFKKQIVWCSSQTLDVGAKVFIEVGKLILCGVMCDSRDYIVDDGDDDNDGGNGNDGGDGGDGHDGDERGNAGDHQATPPDTADEDGTEDNSGEEEDDEDIDADSRTPPLKRARDDTTPPMSSSSSSSSSDDDGMKMDDGERCSKGGSTSPPSVRQWQPIEKLTTLVHEDGTIVIGDNGTRVPVSVLQQANWDNYRKCVRSIMRSLFSREYIANHTLSGKPAPGE